MEFIIYVVVDVMIGVVIKRIVYGNIYDVREKINFVVFCCLYLWLIGCIVFNELVLCVKMDLIVKWVSVLVS